MNKLDLWPSANPTLDYRARNRQLAAGFENWLRVRNYSPRTCDTRLRDLERWLDFLGSDDLTAITHSRIRLFMAETDNPSAQRSRLSALRAFYRFLVLAGVVHFSPAEFIQLQKKRPPRLPRILTESEIERLMHAASTLRARAILEIFYATGCRLTEVAQLRVCDVDFRHGEIRVLGKGNRERVALFGEYAAKALRAYLDGRKTGALFLGHHGKAVGCPQALLPSSNRSAAAQGYPTFIHTCSVTVSPRIYSAGESTSGTFRNYSAIAAYKARKFIRTLRWTTFGRFTSDVIPMGEKTHAT
jgi:site-specific recombinase XerD